MCSRETSTVSTVVLASGLRLRFISVLECFVFVHCSALFRKFIYMSTREASRVSKGTGFRTANGAKVLMKTALMLCQKTSDGTLASLRNFLFILQRVICIC